MNMCTILIYAVHFWAYNIHCPSQADSLPAHGSPKLEAPASFQPVVAPCPAYHLPLNHLMMASTLQPTGGSSENKKKMMTMNIEMSVESNDLQ